MEEKKFFINNIRHSIEQNLFVRLTLSKNFDQADTLKKVIIKKAIIKKEVKFSIIFRHKTKDITKNYPIKEGLATIEKMVKDTFQIATLFTIEQDLVLETYKNKQTKLQKRKPAFLKLPALTHDKQKNNLLTQTNYLIELGILDGQGRVKKDKGDKYKQIKKFIEIIDGLIRKQTPADKLSIYDMGSGKGYLTFALYDYIINQLKLKAEITGIEIREDLINLCNGIAKKVNFNDLHFEKGFISNYELSNTDVLIALHACDTATDDAIFKGIQSGAKLIVCAPCCHKQIRKQLNPTYPLNSMTDYGILKERQSEMVTDTIRALLLEANGYKAKVFEFISTDHTGKNVMIVGEKHSDNFDEKPYLKKVNDLKKTFGIEYHYLEKLLIDFMNEIE